MKWPRGTADWREAAEVTQIPAPKVPPCPLQPAPAHRPRSVPSSSDSVSRTEPPPSSSWTRATSVRRSTRRATLSATSRSSNRADRLPSDDSHHRRPSTPSHAGYRQHRARGRPAGRRRSLQLARAPTRRDRVRHRGIGILTIPAGPIGPVHPSAAIRFSRADMGTIGCSARGEAGHPPRAPAPRGSSIPHRRPAPEDSRRRARAHTTSECEPTDALVPKPSCLRRR